MNATKTGYIATADFGSDTVKWIGEGETPSAAFDDLINSGEFKDYCECKGFEDESIVEVRVFKAIFKGDPEWDDFLFDEDWEWALGEQVDSKKVMFLE